MEKKKICFDIDGTLITTDKQPIFRYEVVVLLISFHKLGWEIYLHSGGGVEYCLRWAQRLKQKEELTKDVPLKIAIKGDKKIHYNIAVDDCIEEEQWSKKKEGNYINADYFIKV